MWLGAIVVAYAIGSIPFGVLLGAMRGIDIRQHGSRNVGATNVSRVLGRRLGLLCFGLDALKGAVPVLAAGALVGVLRRPGGTVTQPELWLWLAVAAATILGHMYSVFLGFKGGKGVATGFGAMLGFWPILTIPAVAALIIWIIVAAIWRYVSLASMLAAAMLPLLTTMWLLVLRRETGGASVAALEDSWPLIATTTMLAIIVIWRHRSNIGRLRRGEEPRIGG